MSDEQTTPTVATPYFKDTFASICLYVDEREPDIPPCVNVESEAYRYDKDVFVEAFTISKRSPAVEFIVEGEDFLVSAKPWDKKGWNVDEFFFKSIEAAVPRDKEHPGFQHVVTQDVVGDGVISLNNIIDPVPPVIQVLHTAIGKLERHNLFVDKIILGTDLASLVTAQIARYGELYEAPESELQPFAIVSNFPVYSTTRIPANVGYLFAEPHLLGMLPYDAERGYMGMVITNPKGIVKIEW